MPLGSVLQGLTTLAVVVVGSVIAGKLFSRIGQPTVLGPITLGIVVGTAVAGCPESARAVLVSDTSQYLLDAVGTAGLLLLMFSVGAELRGAGRSEERAPRWRLAPSVLVPIGICALAAWPFAGRLAESGHNHTYGWLFVGVALGVTAVPVLAWIIRDLDIGSLPVAQASLGIAVGTDGVAWLLVTVMVIFTHMIVMSIPVAILGAALLLMVTIVIPRIVDRNPLFVQRSALGMMVVSTLAGAAATQFLGFHPAIGALTAGFFFPAARIDLSSQRASAATVNVLMPAFFVSAAMSVPLQALCQQLSWGGLCCVAVLAVAAFGSKLIAGLLFGAISGWPWRPSTVLGVLLNCRGVTEIAIASVGFQAELISAFAFAALCGLAVITTAATAPAYRALTAEPVTAVRSG